MTSDLRNALTAVLPRLRRFGLAASALLIVAPLGLELAGIVPSSYAFEDGKLIVLPQMTELPRLGTYVFVALGNIGSALVPALFVAQWPAVRTSCRVGLLIAVLIPAIGSVRRRAREASTSSTIATLAVGLESFKSDMQCGGEYPPSASDVVQTFGRSGLTYRVQNPYAPPSDPPTLPNMPMSGAGLLYWALLGADGLGTPGFSAIRSSSPYWGAGTDSRPGGAYRPFAAPGECCRGTPANRPGRTRG